MFPLYADQGVGLIPWSPLARRRLTRDWDATSPRGRTDERSRTLYRDTDREIVEQVTAVADARGVSRAQVALAWVYTNPQVDSAIVGVTKASHLSEALAALDLELTDTEVAQLVRAYYPREFTA